MPYHDVFCRRCGAERPNTYVPLVRFAEPTYVHGFKETQGVALPVCCGEEMGFHPPSVVMDALEPMQEFSTTVEDGRGGHRVELIDSLAKLRRVERESEQRFRNGEGRPMVWRDYTQDHSNRDVHTIAPDPAPALDRATRQRFGPHVSSIEAPDAPYGPGVSDANTSALPEAP